MATGYRRPLDTAALANNFRVFAAADCAAEPLYAALSDAIATRDDVLALLMEAPYPQRRPVMLFAATHDLLLAGTRHPLAAFYRSLSGDGVVPRTDVERAIEDFADFCAVHRAALVERLLQRAVQTNEVGRSAGLRLALATLSSSQPIALIDVGCSAGLNLLVDRYRHEYALPDGSIVVEGPDSAVVVPATIVDRSPFVDGPRALPTIVRRAGIDRSPLDVRVERDARWLRACVWPSDAGRHQRLAAAIPIGGAERLELHAGDAVERLPDVLDAIPAGIRPVVFHSWVVSYFDQVSKRAFVDAVRAMVAARDGAWISAEGPGVVPGLSAPALPDDADATRREATVWHVTTRSGDEVVTRALARSHAHGRWIEWLAP